MMETPAPASGPRSIALGIFVLSQLAFLFGYNIIYYLQEVPRYTRDKATEAIELAAPQFTQKKGVVWDNLDSVYRVLHHWVEGTGMHQRWALFAPTVATQIVFPAVELHWNDDPATAPALAKTLAGLAASQPFETFAFPLAVARSTPPKKEPTLVLSDNEPIDKTSYFRYRHLRLRRFESNVILVLRPLETETHDEMLSRWRENIRSHVLEYDAYLQAYLRWRIKPWVEAGTPPRCVVMKLRRYPIQAPDAATFIEGPEIETLLRWQVGSEWEKGFGPLEWFDPVTRSFTPLRS